MKTDYTKHPLKFQISERSFVLKEKMLDEDSGKHKDFTLLETFRMIDVVNFLAEELGGGE